MGIQIPKCYSHSFETCALIKCSFYVAFWTEFAHLHSAGRPSFLYPEVGCSIWHQQGIKKYKRVLAYFCSLWDLPTYLVKTILSVKMHIVCEMTVTYIKNNCCKGTKIVFILICFYLEQCECTEWHLCGHLIFASSSQETSKKPL